MSTHLTQAPVSDPRPGYSARLPVLGAIHESLRDLKANWYWFVALGTALLVLGLAAMSYSGLATLATAVAVGYFLIAAGVVYVGGAFFTGSWGGFFITLLGGVLHLAVGVLVLDQPGEAVLIYTLLMAAFFFVEGLFRIVGALAGRFRHWGWMLLNGVATLALGVMIWRQWPVSGLYVVGLFLGINLVLSGASYMSLGLRVRRLPV